mgnify:CR=1 FL=1
MNYKNILASSPRKSIGNIIARLAGSGETKTTAVSGLSIFRWDQPTEPVSGLYEPSVCMVMQGAKRVTLGEDTYVYDAEHYLITSIHLPATYQVLKASPAKPFLGLSLALDLQEVSQLMANSPLPPPRSQQSGRGMGTGNVTPELLDAVHRLVALLETEPDIPILAPLIQREILYRLLTGELGPRLRQIAVAGSQSRQIGRAIQWLKGNFTEPLHIERLASQAGMSVSTFHHHFRSMTALSPLQSQKQLRLQDARRLMLAERLDAASAGFQVGYESPSQFSREYSRLFGAPPLRDIARLRRGTAA